MGLRRFGRLLFVYIVKIFEAIFNYSFGVPDPY